jgi:tetratricopeptide (TPR) repeat protein
MKKIDNDTGVPEDDFHREGLIDRLSQYVAAEPGAWHVRYNLGVALMHDGNPDAALEQFRTVLSQSPKHMESMINIGAIYLAQGEPEEALKIFTSALTVWDVPLVRANMAVAYQQIGRLEEAEKELRRALDAHPDMPDAWTNLGSILLQTDRLEESLEASQKALDLRPDFAMAHNNMAVALSDLGKEDQAREYAQKALTLGYKVHDQLLERLGLQDSPE